jgi:hypothetical protein
MRPRLGAPRPNAEQDPVNPNPRTEREHELEKDRTEKCERLSYSTHVIRGIGESGAGTSIEQMSPIGGKSKKDVRPGWWCRRPSDHRKNRFDAW